MPQERSQPKRESPEEIAKRETAAKKRTTRKPAGEKKTAEASAPAKKAAAEKPRRKRAPAKKAAKTTAAAKPKPEAKPRRRRRTEPPPRSRPVVRARAKYVRSSARKARLVIEHIRGKSVDDARAVLRHSPRGIAVDLEKLLNSAVANAENNHELVADDLLVKEASADEGPTLRRFRPRAQGRATRIRKRTSHLSISLTTKE